MRTSTKSANNLAKFANKTVEAPYSDNMDTFGKRLRTHRLQTKDPDTGKYLSQAKLAKELGYSGRMIGYWETDKKRPPTNNRPLLIEIISMLSKFGGLDTANEANQLLVVAGYSSLTETEVAKLQLEPIDTNAESMSEPLHQAPISQNPTLDEEKTGAVPLLLTNIWYTARTYTYATLWRDYDLGTLHVHSDFLYFDGEATQIEIRRLIQIEHRRQTGDINANWVRLTYYDDNNEKKIAWLAQSNRLGIGGIVGGSHQLYEQLWQRYNHLFDA